MSKKILSFILNNLIWFLLLLVIAFFSAVTGKFLTITNLINILLHAAVLGMLSIGMSFVLVTGNLDISIESTLAISAMIGAYLVTPAGIPYYGSGLNVPIFIAVSLGLLFSLFIGFVNGNLITHFHMNNFIVTLAMLIAVRGLMRVPTYGNTIYYTPEAYNAFGASKIGGIPLPVITLLVCFIIAYFLLSRTRFGRELYAIGGNKEAARASGINPEKRIRQVYLISAFLAGLAGWMIAGRLTSVIGNLGEGMSFEVLAACVVGGVSLQGGRGTIIGLFGGVLLLSTVGSGLNLTNVSAFWVSTIRGLIILLAMIIDSQKIRLGKQILLK